MSDGYEAVTFARSTDRPLVRASYMKRFVEAFAGLPEPTRRELEDAMGEELRLIADANGLAWLPFEVNHALTRELARTLGPDGFEAFFRGMFGKVWRSPLLETLTDYVIRLAGRDVGSAARFFGRGFTQIFRHAGTWQVLERGDLHVRLEFAGFPDLCLEDSNVWLDSVRASLGSVFELVEAEAGEVELAVETSPKVRAVFALRWREQGCVAEG